MCELRLQGRATKLKGEQLAHSFKCVNMPSFAKKTFGKYLKLYYLSNVL